ncbi:MAG: short-chain dehydrogenase [Azospirillum brasilense]|nr:MAG: short-chain dehydrogenase [Azospirillum brasilense]
MHQASDKASQARKPMRWRNGIAFVSALFICACAAGDKSQAQAMPKPDWSLSDMPSQQGRIVLITGGSSGIGYEAAKAIAGGGARVIIASRNEARAQEAIAKIRMDVPNAQVEFEELDLASLASVQALSERLSSTLPHIDVLINNAGVMEPPVRELSADGYEMQFAVNYLGHFALTQKLLPLLQQAPAPRIVSLSSIAARQGTINFADLHYKNYDSFDAYSQSKLACLIFARELQRRSLESGWGVTSIATHPGVSRTDLLINRGGLNGFMRRNFTFMFQPADRGALPTIYAATAPDAQAGAYYGPTGMMETRGELGLAEVPQAATDEQTAAHLWAISEELANVRYPSQQ